MASNLPGSICVGQHSVCIIRVARLLPDCSPQGNTDGGFVTAGIITATATPELQEGQSFEPINGCGDIAWTFETPDRIRKFTLAGELAFFDHEMMEVLFGGSIIVGNAGDFSGDNIGWAAPNYTDPAPPANYIEFITKVAAEGVGECNPAGDPFPTAVGHIFGKARLTPGDRTFAAEAATVAFTGESVANSNLGDGPWQDWTGIGSIPTSPYVQVSYDDSEYDAIAALAACGWQDLPAQT